MDNFFILPLVMIGVFLIFVYMHHLYEDRKKQTKLYQQALLALDNLDSQYNALLDHSDKMTSKNLRLLDEYCANSKYISSLENTVVDLENKLKYGSYSGSNSFSNDELKRLAFCVHPDKNGGKTDELWRKVQNMVKK